MRQPNALPFILTCLLAAAGPVGAQAPLGAEIAVNSYTTGIQARPHIARDGTDAFVVVWDSYDQDGSDYGIFARRFDSAGDPQGAEFQVNAYTTGRQVGPVVAKGAAGDFVVMWTSGAAQDGSDYSIQGRKFLATGAPDGGEFTVNTYGTSRQEEVHVSQNALGSVVAVWASYAQDGSAFGVFGRRFNAAGPVGGEFQVNTQTADSQYAPAVALRGDGSFVVVWESKAQDGDGVGVFGQRFDAAGAMAGSEFQVNTYTTGDQKQASVAADATGNFVVVWTSFGQAGSTGVFGQRFHADGSGDGEEFPVSAPGGGAAFSPSPSVAAKSDGGFSVAWEIFDGSDRGIAAQFFDASGVPDGGEFTVNAYVPGAQHQPSVAMRGDGRFVVAWASEGQDGDGLGVFAQRLDTLDSPSVMEFAKAGLDVAESAGKAKVVVKRTGHVGRPATVNYATADGSAKEGSDYTEKLGTLNFAANETSKTVNVTIKNDTAVEGLESLTVTLFEPSGSAAALGELSEATVRIADNEGNAFYIYKRAYGVHESDGTVKISVRRSGSLSGTATVKLTTTADTATAGADYTTQNKTLTFTPGMSSKNVSIPIVNDAVAEENETFKVKLSVPTGAVLGTQRMTTVTIDNNE